ncbi:MAG: Ig-like domain-containing protein, partial [bacterium]
TTSDGGYNDSSLVTVTSESIVHVTGVSVSPSTAYVQNGNEIALTATVEPKEATNKSVVWNSRDESIATVSGGIVTGLADGSTYVVVTTGDNNYKDSTLITVTSEAIVPVTGVSLTPAVVSLQSHDMITLTAEIEPYNATNKSLSWISRDLFVAKVLNGVVTCFSEGQTYIVVLTDDGNFSDSTLVSVQQSTGIEDDNNFIRKVYPNPATEYINIYLSKPVSGNLEIVSIMGELVLNQEMENTRLIKVDLTGFAPGMYFIRLKTGIGKFYHKYQVIE